MGRLFCEVQPGGGGQRVGTNRQTVAEELPYSVGYIVAVGHGAVQPVD